MYKLKICLKQTSSSSQKTALVEFEYPDGCCVAVSKSLLYYRRSVHCVLFGFLIGIPVKVKKREYSDLAAMQRIPLLLEQAGFQLLNLSRAAASLRSC